MSLHGSARTDSKYPQAHAICDMCGFTYNLVDLKWNLDWRGPRLQNLRQLVCDSCQDQPQPNGQRTIILPPDPEPVRNARPEYYVPADNPLSGLGASPLAQLWQYSNQIGTLISGGGVPAAFDGNVSKPVHLSATIPNAKSSFQNYVGINWTGNQNTLAAPSSLKSPVLQHTLSSYTITAAFDVGINSTGYVVQGSPVDAGWGSWTTLASGDIAGTAGEILSGVPTSGSRYQFHRVAFYGGTGSISVAQVSFSVADGSSR